MFARAGGACVRTHHGSGTRMPRPHPTNQPEGPDRPTAKQLRYLRALANRRGQTFTYPLTIKFVR